MKNNNNYYIKYKKYKSKYINLKGGLNDWEIILDKIKGCLYGVAVGDALGTRYEFLESVAVKDQLKFDMDGEFLPLLGGGPFNTSPGQVSDDTEMMLSLLRSLAQLQFYDGEDVAHKYIEWFNTKPIDIGKTIRQAIFTRKPSLDKKDMVQNSAELNHTSLSNGVLMRIAPLGVYGLQVSDKELKEIVKQECILTHPNPIIIDACYIYCLAIKYILQGLDKKVVWQRLKDKCCSTPRVRIILADSMERPEPVFLIYEEGKETYTFTDNQRWQGYFGVALQNTFYELLYGNDYDSSMINILKRGGDTDTNCAIAGGLLGAYYGYKSINNVWASTVINADYDRIKEYKFLSVNNIDNYINELFNK